MKQIHTHILVILFLTLAVNSYSQSKGDVFYYYKNEKVFLTTDKSTIALSFEGENSIDQLKTNSAIAGINTAAIAEDYTRVALITIDENAKQRQHLKTFYAEIKTDIKEMDAYHKTIETYKTIKNVIMSSPCFTTEGDKKIGLSNSFYVKLRDQNDVDKLYEQAKQLKVEVLGHNEYMPLWFTLSCGSQTKHNALEAANLFYETGIFESAEPAFMYHDLEASTDPLFPNQWGLKNTGQYGAAYAGIDIKAEQAWGISTGSATIKTAVFDHGFEMNHPDLIANTFGTGYDATTGTSPAQVRGNHGTACAGIVSAKQNNSLGISGVSPNSKLMSISISLLFSDTPQQLANGFNWAWTNGADVISNSWGGYAPSSIIDDAITNTLTNGRGGKGTVIVFAAGNENNTNIRYPGNSNPNILVVGALSPCGERKNLSSCDGENFWGSCYGSQLDIMAPGVKIPTTDRQGANGYTPTDYTTTFNGTSSACPYVAGVAALILSANPNLTAVQVNTVIEQTAQKVRTDLYSYAPTLGRPNGTWHNEMGYGLVNAYDAVLAVSCPFNLVVTTNVTTTDSKQASNHLTASNVIMAGANASYHAGNEVLLSAGFWSQSNSTFRGYILGCGLGASSDELVSRSNKISYDFRYNNGSTTEGSSAPHERMDNVLTTSASPNPFTTLVDIHYMVADNNSNLRMELFSMDGKKIRDVLAEENVQKGNYSLRLNTQELPVGLYLLVVTKNNTQENIKIVKL